MIKCKIPFVLSLWEVGVINDELAAADAFLTEQKVEAWYVTLSRYLANLVIFSKLTKLSKKILSIKKIK